MRRPSSSRFLFATLLSVYNKWMFSPDRFAFPYPLFVTSLHMLIQFILAGVLRYSLPAHFKPEHNPNPRDYVCVVLSFTLRLVPQDANHPELQSQGISHRRDDGDGYRPIKSLPQVHHPLVLQYGSSPALVHPLRTDAPTSYVQVLVANLRALLRLSLSPRKVLLAPRIRHHPHLRWCRSHGRHRNCLPLYRDAHRVLRVCTRWFTMEPDADPTEEATHGDGYTCCDGILARSCNGIHISARKHSG